MEVLDTIFDHATVTKLNESRLQYISFNYFTIPLFKNTGGLILIAKEKNYWLAISLPDDNSYRDIKVRYNGVYLFYETYFTHGSRGINGSYSYFNIIDPVEKICVEVPSMVNLETYNTDTVNSIPETSSCGVKIVFEGNTLTAFATGDSPDCLESGSYRIDNNRLMKCKHYDEGHYRMTNVNWAGNISTWMTLAEVKTIYDDATIEKINDLYSICAEDERPAYLIKNANDTTAVVLLDAPTETYIQKIVVFSKNISFKNVSTALTAKQVLNLYPKATLQTDLLSEDEYILLDELKIKIVFRTTENNRVGKYKDEKYINLKRPSAKIDFIEIN